MRSPSVLAVGAGAAILLAATGLALAQNVPASASPPLSPVGRLAQLNLREQALNAHLGRDRGRLSSLLGALMLFRRDPPPALLVSPSDARDAVNAAILIRAITPELRRRADLLAGQGRELAALRREAAVAEADAMSAESESAELRGSQGQSAADLLSPGTDQSPQTPAPPVVVVAPMKTLSPPVLGPVVRRFGDAVEGSDRARGVSIRTTKGAMVKSPAAGVVEFAGEVNGWGVVLILRTSGAYHLVLAGLQQSSVLPGQSVAAGALVGQAPDGGSSGPEVYFEVRAGGTPVDPARWLPEAAHP
jgi:septal ring factor EnvC (AmiA/AmiB activator)